MPEENHGPCVPGCRAGSAGICIPGLAVPEWPDGNLRGESITYVAYKKHVRTETGHEFYNVPLPGQNLLRTITWKEHG